MSLCQRPPGHSGLSSRQQICRICSAIVFLGTHCNESTRFFGIRRTPARHSRRETLAVARESRGHLAGAYLRLLRFLVDRRTGLRYSWAEPKSERTSHRSVLQAEAGPLVEALSSATDLGREAVTLEGTFERFNRGSGAWGLLTTGGQRLGTVHDGGPSLDGLEVGGRYVFCCDEVIEEVDITGRESRTLYLNRHEPV